MKKRFLFHSLVSHLEDKSFTIIIGARQTGKSTLLLQLKEHCTGLGMPVVFFNLEDRDTLASLDASPENIFLYIPDVSGKVYVFIDELQKLADPSNFLKVLRDNHNDKIKIVAAASRKFYVDEKLNDSKIFNLHTCTFEESLYLRGETALLDEFHRLRQNRDAKSPMLPALQTAFYDYMSFGGYPEVVMADGTDKKTEILKNIKDRFIKKDIDDANIKDESAFYRLMQMLAVQVGELVNVSELSKAVKIKEETVTKYLDIMVKSLHIRLVKPFYKNLDKEMVKMPKVYFMDSGLRNVLSGNFLPIPQNPAKDGIWKNQVFRILADKFGVEKIRFWRTIYKKEVDFIIPPFAIEAKSNNFKTSSAKYKVFTTAYPVFSLGFYCLEPFNEDLIRKL